MNFTESQIRAIETDAREVLVLAGAGSGKTRVLTSRIVRLLRGGDRPDSLMVLTFTRRAAEEMRSRIAEQLGGDEAAEKTVSRILMGTFHSVALRIVQAYGDRLGYVPGQITVIDQSDSEPLLRSVCRDCGFLDDNGKWRHGLSMKKIASALEDIHVDRNAERDRKTEARLSIALSAYRSALREAHVMDYGAILLECRRLLSDHPDVLEKYRARIKHVFVDEIQDTDRVQFDLHDFFSPPATFFGVGDFRQSIYGFRGAVPDAVLERHALAERIELRECFRCGDAIVDAANGLIAHDADNVAEPMIGATGRAGSVNCFMGRSIDIAQRVIEIHGNGHALGDVAVLARKHAHLARVERACEEAGIPTRRVGGGGGPTNTEEFRRLHAYMRIICNPNDYLALLRLAPELGCSTADLSAARLAVLRGECRSLASRIGGIRVVNQLVGDDAVFALLEILDDSETWEKQYWKTNCRGMSISEALEWHAARNEERGDDYRGDASRVTLITAHAAKGLEWPVVIVVNCNEGEFPGSVAVRGGEIDEERRLMYVAATRARERLDIHWRRPCDQAGDKPAAGCSRFIAEMRRCSS